MTFLMGEQEAAHWDSCDGALLMVAKSFFFFEPDWEAIVTCSGFVSPSYKFSGFCGGFNFHVVNLLVPVIRENLI